MFKKIKLNDVVDSLSGYILVIWALHNIGYVNAVVICCGIVTVVGKEYNRNFIILIKLFKLA